MVKGAFIDLCQVGLSGKNNWFSGWASQSHLPTPAAVDGDDFGEGKVVALPWQSISH